MRRERLVPFVKIIAAAAFLVAIAAFVWLAVGSQSSTPVRAATFPIPVGDNWFCNGGYENGVCETNIVVGDKVTWAFDSTVAHTTTECGDLCGFTILNPETREWHFGPTTSLSFSPTFDTAGTFQYQCNIHPGQMRGTIIVGDGGTPLPMPPEGTPTPVEPTLSMPPSPTPSVTPTPVETLSTPPSPESSVTPTSVAPTLTATSVPTSTTVPGPTSTPPGMRGDVNGDGIVNPIDAALVLQFSAGMLPMLPSFERGDVNQDGTVNAIDAALILQFAAGLLTTL